MPQNLRLWQCWGSVTFWYGSGSSDPYLGLTDPDPTPFIFFHHLGTLTSVLKIKYFAKFCFEILFCKHYFSPLNTFEKREEISTVPPTNGSGSGGPKTSGSPTLVSDPDWFPLIRSWFNCVWIRIRIENPNPYPTSKKAKIIHKQKQCTKKNQFI